MKVSLVIVNKDEASLADTLSAVEALAHDRLEDVVVVDASQRRLDRIRLDHPWVTWYDYEQPEGIKITISHQRNIGVARAVGDVIVFIDSGCIPQANWLTLLLAPIIDDEESVTCGPAVSTGKSVYSGPSWWGQPSERYVPSAPTINIAFRREAFETVNGFDESFAAGEDIDFTWRLHDAGYRLRWVSTAIVEHDWGGPRRQMRRSFNYGVAWSRLFHKHPRRLKRALQEYPVPVVYPLFLLGAPLTIKYRAYPLLLFIPLWHARRAEAPLLIVLDHVVQAAGVLADVVGFAR